MLSAYALSNDIFSLPNPSSWSAHSVATVRDGVHCNYRRAGGDVLDQTFIEWTGGEVDVVLSRKRG